MALVANYNKIPNYANVIYNKDPDSEGKVSYKAHVYAIIHLTMFLDLGKIESTNLSEWAFRLGVLSKLGGDFRTIAESVTDDEGKIETTYRLPTMSEIESLVGLTTNVITTRRQDWLRRVTLWLKEDGERAVRLYDAEKRKQAKPSAEGT